MFGRFVLRGAPLTLFTIVLASAPASAAPPPPAPASVVRMDKIAIPGKPLKAWDIGWVDAPSTKYYLADRTNASVDVVDGTTDRIIAQIGGFVGAKSTSDASGPDGVLVTFSNRELWAGDGDSTVKVIDLTTNSIVATISTGGKLRTDEMTYDPKDNLVISANNADDPPFASIISVASRTVLKTIPFPNATNGAEQPVYDAQTGMVYLSVPATKASPGGEMAVIDPVKMAVVGSYPLTNCGPNGAALGPGNQLLAGCGNSGRSIILDKTNGNVLADFTNNGGSDEVWFNPGDHRYYLAETNDQNLGIIDASTFTGWVVQSGVGAHSVAADWSSNHVFVPIGATDPACPNGCIAVYSSANLENRGKSRAF